MADSSAPQRSAGVDRLGVALAAGAYLLWGVLPVYLKALRGVRGLEVLASRVVFSLVFLCVVLAFRGGFGFVRTAMRREVIVRFVASSALISVNWLLYIWSVASDRVVDASFGYFINPLVNVVLASLVLRERLRRGQWIAVALAASGVVYLTVLAGELPWIGLVLAVTFATYGLLRKTASLGGVEGLAMETGLLAPLALGLLVWLAIGHESQLAAGPWSSRARLMLAGPVTAIPLVLFAEGARRIPFSMLGLLQYIGPTLQLLLGVFAFGEPMSPARLLGFALIWSACVVYTAEGLIVARSMRPPVA